MKTKQTFYLLLILLGASLMASGENILRKEYAFSLGIVLLMFGVYKTSQGYNRPAEKKEDPKEQ